MLIHLSWAIRNDVRTLHVLHSVTGSENKRHLIPPFFQTETNPNLRLKKWFCWFPLIFTTFWWAILITALRQKTVVKKRRHQHSERLIIYFANSKRLYGIFFILTFTIALVAAFFWPSEALTSRVNFEPSLPANEVATLTWPVSGSTWNNPSPLPLTSSKVMANCESESASLA